MFRVVPRGRYDSDLLSSGWRETEKFAPVETRIDPTAVSL